MSKFFSFIKANANASPIASATVVELVGARSYVHASFPTFARRITFA